ncbi:MAG: hypothetical protein ACTSPM_06260 [Candidatus Heimdallarchaeota archaeon]
MKRILLVPSAILIPDELKFELGYIPTAMIPLHGKPALEHIFEKYTNDEKIFKFVAGNQAKDKIQNYIERREEDIQIIDIPILKDLGNTIYQSLAYLDEKNLLENSFLYLNFADTIPELIDLKEKKNFVVYSTVDDPFRWTTFDVDKENKITTIRDKFFDVITDQMRVFVGVFGFANPLKFYKLLKNQVVDKSSVDSFYLALSEYLQSEDYELKFIQDWIDVGHLDTYYDAKKKYLNTRSFNDITLDIETNILVKKSENKKKLIDEINWYLKLPKNLQHYVPRIYDFSLDVLSPFVKMEFVGYPCLSDVYLYGAFTHYMWASIFNVIFAVIENLRNYQTNFDDNKKIKDSLHEMYYQKTVNRLNSLRKDKNFNFLFENDEVIINGKKYKSLNYIIDVLDEKLTKFKIYDLPNFNIIHGDLCFPNIFFDVRSKIVKLVDPRGSFGEFDIFGDYRYDLAKLQHSVKGHYDFIINGLFDVTVDASGKQIDFSIYLEEKYEEISKLFSEKIKQKFGKISKTISLIESILFLSMIPLHSDYIDRQYIMLATGIKLFNETCL